LRSGRQRRWDGSFPNEDEKRAARQPHQERRMNLFVGIDIGTQGFSTLPIAETSS
jgi:hypothetical protein